MSLVKYLSANGKRILAEIPWDREVTSVDLQKKLPDLSTREIAMVISYELAAGFVTKERRKVGYDEYMFYQRFR